MGLGDDLLEWFDFYLRDGPPTSPYRGGSGQYGGWRVESTYPPEDLDWMMIGMDQCDYFGSAVIGLTRSPFCLP